MDRDRSKGERQGVESNAEQAVIKHFEESLRRAKEKKNMRGAWTINSIPVAQQNHYAPHQQPVQPPIQSLAKPPDDYIANELAAKHGFWPQNVYFNRKANTSNDVTQSPHHHQPQMGLRQQRAEYHPTSHPHHDISPATQSTSHSKLAADKIHLINNDATSATNQLTLFAYGYPNTAPYHKDVKSNKPEILLANQPSMINQQSAGVIVKHDTSMKSSPIQVPIGDKIRKTITPVMVMPHQSPSPQQPAKQHQMVQYKKIPITSANVSPLNTAPVFPSERYAQQYQHQPIQMPLSQPVAFQYGSPHSLRQSPTTDESNHSNDAERHRIQQLPNSILNAQNKPKVSSPAPSKIYGKPESLSTAQTKIGAEVGLDRVQPIQDPKFAEPPPAHSQSRKYNMLPPTRPMNDARDAIRPESQSPGLHLPTVSNPIGMSQSIYMQMPLDLGVIERNRIILNSHTANNHSGMLQSPFADIKPKASTSPITSYDRDLSVNLAPRMRRSSSPANDYQYDKSNILRIIAMPDITISDNDSKPAIALAERDSIVSMNATKKPNCSRTPNDIHEKHGQNYNSSNIYHTNANRSVDDCQKTSVNNSTTNDLSNDDDNYNTNHTNESNDDDDNNNNHSNNVTKSDSSKISDNDTNNIDNGPNRNNRHLSDDHSSKCNDDANTKLLNDNLTILSSPTNSLRTNSADGLLRSSSSNSTSPAPSPYSAQSAPATPAKLPTECDKPTSPAAPRHLKKAWLQRHTIAEDSENNVKTSSVPSQPNSTSPTKNPIDNHNDSDSTKTSSAHTFDITSTAINSTNKKPETKMHPKKAMASSSMNPSPKRDSDTIGLSKMENSSSSEESIPLKVAPKRKLTKSKRRKPAFKKKKVKLADRHTAASESEKESGDSDKDSMSDKDSDNPILLPAKDNTNDGSSNDDSNLNSNGTKGENDQKRRRTAKVKVDDANAKRRKTCRLSGAIRLPPVNQLKRSGEAFVQHQSCSDLAPNKLPKCSECRQSAQQAKNMTNIFCRFYAFRKIRYAKSGQLNMVGFSDPLKDPSEEDVALWMPNDQKPPLDLELEHARYLLEKVGDEFCNLNTQERIAQNNEHMSADKTVAWKRVVEGVREMCDVCETTLFNFHWTCGKCGFVVCTDCYKARKYKDNEVHDRAEKKWMACTNKSVHDLEKLMLTQIIAGESLSLLNEKMHMTRDLWGIPQHCGCHLVGKKYNAEMKEIVQRIMKDNKKNGVDRSDVSSSDSESVVKKRISEPNSALRCLADVALKNENQSPSQNDTVAHIKTELGIDADENIRDDTSESSDSSDENHSALRSLLMNKSTPTSPEQPSRPNDDTEKASTNKLPKKSCKQFYDEISKKDMQQPVNEHSSNAPRTMSLAYSKQLYVGVEHMWFCEGKLLRLLEPNNPKNLEVFREQWKRRQPVLVSNVNKQLDTKLWRPESFSEDFGDEGNDLVNCLTGTLIPNQPMKRFWDGFNCIGKRIKDENGEPMLLKLKDWPPGEDFADILPTRYADIVSSLPLCDYTKREGKFNLASRLPECFVKPDLGPKMYNAYGSASNPTKGTTNLHLDISDAVNIMVYVGVPSDAPDREQCIQDATKAIDESGCDALQRKRVREKNELPGALWHIYSPRDADKIRDLLNKVAIERGIKLEEQSDAIHDQSWYLDNELRERLYAEYSVVGYPIAQCLGDAIFIPAGAPHQVRNLHNCIKVAEDFVSPENVSECFKLTQEFRRLSDTHSNHEDKLQIKNIIYHAVKGALSVLSNELEKHIAKDQNLMDKKPEIKTETADDIAKDDVSMDIATDAQQTDTSNNA